MNVLTVESLNKNFGKIEALKDVNLNVERGSILGLLGPNGAGKTTLLRIINGILVKDSGDVKVLGKDISLDVARHIGYMPEERGLYDNMTVTDMIMLLGQLKGGDKDRLRIVMNNYLEFFNLSQSANRKIKELSKGNQQKVQIISTIVHEPELVILDEPFSGFDPINGALLQSLIAHMHDAGTTVILSSHNMHAVEEMCESIALINKGTLLLSGRLDDIKENHKTNELLITVPAILPLSELSETKEMESIKPDIVRHGRKGFAYRITRSPGVSNIDVMAKVSQYGDILHFEEALPSLNDIFIRYTTNEVV